MKVREENMNKNSKAVYLGALAYSFITGLSFAFTKIALDYTNPFNILGHRFIFALVAIIITLVIKGKTSYFNKENFKEILPLALVYPLLFFGFQTFGLKDVDSSLGGIILSMAPIFTLILARVFLKEKPSKGQVAFVLLAVSGVVFIFYNIMRGSDRSNSNIVGILLLLITTICFSSYSIMARSYTAKYENLELLTVMISIGFIAFNILALAMNIKNNSFSTYISPLKEGKYLLAMVYLGVLSTLGTSMLTNYVLKYISPSKMSVFANLSTLISIIGGVVILNESIYYYHILGAILIVVGVLGTNLYKGKNI